jgi:hypothetical protein
MLGISLYSYLYLKLAIMLCFSYLLGFLINEIGEQEGGTGSAQEGRGGEEVTQTRYTHLSKCKNDKMRERIFKKE